MYMRQCMWLNSPQESREQVTARVSTFANELQRIQLSARSPAYMIHLFCKEDGSKAKPQVYVEASKGERTISSSRTSCLVNLLSSRSTGKGSRLMRVRTTDDLLGPPSVKMGNALRFLKTPTCCDSFCEAWPVHITQLVARFLAPCFICTILVHHQTAPSGSGLKALLDL